MTYILSGATEVSYEQIKSINTPQPKDRWRPVPHKTVASNFIGLIEQRGYGIESTKYGLDKFGDMFGYIRLRNEAVIGNNADHIKQVIGFRNSHNKRFSISAVAGAQVMVCSNLQFRGQFNMRAKHTTNVMDKLDTRINALIDQAVSTWGSTIQSYGTYAKTFLDESLANDLIMKSAEAGAINTTDVLNIKNEYLNPRHSDFKHTNAWALFNASTEILKKAPKQLAAKSIKLHEVYDEFCSV